MRRSNAGFTLIELMVVVAIVGILLAVAIPSYAMFQARGLVRTAQGDVAALAMAVENELQRTLSYPDSALTGTDLSERFRGWTPSRGDVFAYAYAPVGDGYSITATYTGASTALTGCTLSLNSANERTVGTGCRSAVGGAETW